MKFVKLPILLFVLSLTLYPEFVLADAWGDDAALLKAASQGDLKIVKEMLEAGANVDTADDLGNTPLLLATTVGSEEVVRVLLENNAQTNVKAHGLSPLGVAVMRGYLSLSSRLIAGGADLNERDDNGATPLILALRMGRKEMITLLLDSGANVELGDAQGQTPLMFAVRNGDLEATEQLLTYHANIDWRDGGDRSALFWAIVDRQEEAAILLLDKGAEFLYPMRKQTALRMARAFNLYKLVTKLEALGAR